MSNFFEQELWYLFGDEQVIDTPYCSGQSCYGTLDRDLRVRIQFISTHISGQYDALKLTVLNRINGPVDIQVLKLGDILGKKPIPATPISGKVWLPTSGIAMGNSSGTHIAPQRPTMRQSGRLWAVIWMCFGTGLWSGPEMAQNWCTSVHRSGVTWKRTSSSPAKRPRRCSRRATSLSAPT